MHNRVPILMYHSIDDSGSVISTTARKFRKQMQILKDRRFKIISLNDLVSQIRKNQPLPDKTVVITFDDGCKNVYTTAYPILKDYHFTAMVFLVTGYCGKNNQWDNQLKNIPTLDLMNWEDIRVMANNGIEFGAHSMTHANLARLPKKQAWLEIANSKLTIQKIIEKDVLFFAYPYGLHTEMAKRFAEGKYYGACSTELGFVSLKSDIYSLPRIDMYYFSKNDLFNLIGTSKFAPYIFIRRILRSIGSKLIF